LLYKLSSPSGPHCIARGKRIVSTQRTIDAYETSHCQLTFCVSNSHRPPDPTRRCCLCRVRCGGANLPPEKYILCRRASGGLTAPPDTLRHTPTLNALVGRSGRLSSHRHTRHDKTVLSVSCPVCRCEWNDCSERVQTSQIFCRRRS